MVCPSGYFMGYTLHAVCQEQACLTWDKIGGLSYTEIDVNLSYTDIEVNISHSDIDINLLYSDVNVYLSYADSMLSFHTLVIY